jgi:ER lumen protein retaining receptor
VTRYLDLFTNWWGIYNTVMKIVYICSTAAIIYTIRYKEPIKTTYDKGQDSFLHWQFAAAPSAVLALIVHLIGSGLSGFNVQELLWTFSIILESIAILPQLVVLQRYGEVENLTGNYVFFLGAYRALYILNWVYRSQVEPHYRHHWLTYICGIIQTILYADFFYYYVKR